MLGLAGAALAQTYPLKPVRVIVPYAPSSGVAIVTRFVTDELAKSMGQPFVHETRAGAGGTIAMAAAAAAPPDGYTILANSSAHSAVPILTQGLPFDTARDLAGITPLAELTLVMVIARSKGINSVKELIAAAKAKPGSITFASAGVGTAGHLGSEKFRIASGFEALHIPFKSTTDGMSEVMAGRVDYVYTAVASALGAIREGALVPLAVSSRRSAALPDVPGIEETGVPNAAYSVWTGLLAPSKTPRDIVNRLHQEIVKVLASPDMKARLLKVGADAFTTAPEEFDAMIRRELSDNERLVKAAGIKMQ
jgi:tripartite-type tricarboxylate transporter receptor subunit TctC